MNDWYEATMREMRRDAQLRRQEQELKAEAMDDAELQDELDDLRDLWSDIARAPMPIVEPPEDNWRERLHDHWIEADRRMDAQVRAASRGYLGGRD